MSDPLARPVVGLHTLIEQRRKRSEELIREWRSTPCPCADPQCGMNMKCASELEALLAVSGRQDARTDNEMHDDPRSRCGSAASERQEPRVDTPTSDVPTPVSSMWPPERGEVDRPFANPVARAIDDLLSSSEYRASERWHDAIRGLVSDIERGDYYGQIQQSVRPVDSGGLHMAGTGRVGTGESGGTEEAQYLSGHNAPDGDAFDAWWERFGKDFEGDTEIIAGNAWDAGWRRGCDYVRAMQSAQRPDVSDVRLTCSSPATARPTGEHADDSAHGGTAPHPEIDMARIEWLAERVKQQHAIFEREDEKNPSGDPSGHDSLACTEEWHQGCHIYAFVTLAMRALEAGTAAASLSHNDAERLRK